jgi:hypothetical protein
MMLNTDLSTVRSTCAVTKTPGHLLQGRAQLASHFTGVLACVLYPCAHGLALQPQLSVRHPVVSVLFIELMYSFSSGTERFPQVVLVGVQGVSL